MVAKAGAGNAELLNWCSGLALRDKRSPGDQLHQDRNVLNTKKMVGMLNFMCSLLQLKNKK